MGRDEAFAGHNYNVLISFNAIITCKLGISHTQLLPRFIKTSNDISSTVPYTDTHKMKIR